MAIQLLVKLISFIIFWRPVLPNGTRLQSSLTWTADSTYLASNNYLTVVSPQRSLSTDVSSISISSAQLPQINLLLPSLICLNIMQNIFQILRWEWWPSTLSMPCIGWIASKPNHCDFPTVLCRIYLQFWKQFDSRLVQSWY